MIRASALKVEDWPPRDRELWLAARRPGGPFDDDDGYASGWAPATLRSVERGYGVYLSWLAKNGEIDPHRHPCDRVTRELIEAFISAYRAGRSELTVAGAVRGVAYMLRACAPPDGVRWLTALAHKLNNAARPARPKLPRMARAGDLLDLADRLMAKGLTGLVDDRVSAPALYRDGLIIALLTYRPLRRRNLAALRLNHSFVLEREGASIRFGRNETKKGIEIDWRLPNSLFPAFETYLSHVRPILLRGLVDEGWLWLGRRGRKLPENNLTSRIRMLTQKHLGRSVSPHLFRDCAATEIAIEDPAHIGITKTVLGHATLASSQKHYNQATSLTALARHQDVIRRLRGDG